MKNKRTEVTTMNRRMTMPSKGGKGMPMGGKRKLDFRMLGRVVKMLFRYYPRMVPISIACIFFSAITATIPAIFLEKVTTAIGVAYQNHTPWGVRLHRSIMSGCCGTRPIPGPLRR